MKLSSKFQLYCLVILTLVQLGSTHEFTEYIEPNLSVWPHGWPAEGDSVTLHCEVKQLSANRTFHWYQALPVRKRYFDGKGRYTTTLLPDSSKGAGGSYTLSPLTVNHTGYYFCQAEEGNNPAQHTDYSNILPIWVTGLSPSASLVIEPNEPQYFAPLSVSCDVQGNSSGWRIRWFSGRQEVYDCPEGWIARPGPACRTSCLHTDDSGAYWCESESGQRSNAFNITVIESENIPTALGVSPHSWPAEGDLVTLSCEVDDPSADWTFLWYKVFPYQEDSVNVLCPDKQYYAVLLSDSSRGANGSYAVGPASLSDTGRYVCRAARAEPPYHTRYSNVVPVWVTGLSPSASLVSSVNSSQMFVTERLTLSCEGQDNSSVWRLRWHTGRKLNFDCPFQQDYYDWFRSQRREGYVSTCKSYRMDLKDSGVYWCESESGQHSNAINITVFANPKPVMTVWPHSWPMEGDAVTLTCDIGHPTSGWTFFWYEAFPYHGRVFSDPWTMWGYYNGTLVWKSTSENTYSLTPASLAHTAVYACRAQRHGSRTTFSNVVPVWVTGRSPPASLLLEPSGTLHFTKESLSMTCRVEDNSTGWRLRWHPQDKETDCPSGLGRPRGAMLPCSTSWLKMSHSMVYWCESESGQHSNALNITIAERTLSYLTVSPNNWVSEGETVTLRCKTYDGIGDWRFLWYRLMPYRKNEPHLTYEGKRFSAELLSDSSRGAGGVYSLSPVSLDHTAVYVCKGERGEPAYQTHYSKPRPVWVTGPSPPARLVGRPNKTVLFESQAFALSCEGQHNATGWTLRSFTETRDQRTETRDEESDCPAGWTSNNSFTCSTEYLHTKDTGVYLCESGWGQHSNAVNITVKRKLYPSITAFYKWVDEGDSVTLSCSLNDDSPIDWTYQWFKVTAHGGLSSEHSLEPLTDSSRNITYNPVAPVHQGLYVCRAEGGEPLYRTECSSAEPLWVKGLSPQARLVLTPDRRYHFYNGPLTLSCQVHSNSTGWRLRWKTNKKEESQCPESWKTQGSACNTTVDLYDTGHYWCESASGQQSNVVSITVEVRRVLLDAPAHPIVEGEPVTLRCLYNPTPSDISAQFYKGRSLLQTQPTGEMTIPVFSKVHEGWYDCRNPEMRKSESVWVGVKKNIPAVLRVSPHSWPSEGDLVTLNCSVNDSSTTWKFHWYKLVPYNGHIPVMKYYRRFYSAEPLADNRSEEGSYTIGPVGLNHTGMYVCRAEGAGLTHYTDLSQVEHIWVTGPSPSASLVSSTNQSVLFEWDSVSLNCMVWDNSTNWSLRWTAEGSTDLTLRWTAVATAEESGCPVGWSLKPESTCSSSHLMPSDSGVYWCESEAGLLSNAVNLTVKGNITPDLSPHSSISRMEGDSLTLRCELNDTSSNWTIHWYTSEEWFAQDNLGSPVKLPSNSSTGTVGWYTLAPLTVDHTGYYACRAEGGEPIHFTLYSSSTYLHVQEIPTQMTTDTDEDI